jgi:RNA polymerase sporulation-specific sigma factor
MLEQKLLTHEETLHYLAQARKGDIDAKEILVVRNAALVKSIVKKFLGRGAEFEDLMQIGNLGLIKAIMNYCPDYEVRFSTYAVPMIAGEIKRFLRDDGMIKVSRSLKESAFVIFRANEKLKKQLDRDPTMEELSAETGIAKEDIVMATESVKAPVSIFEPAYDDENSKMMLIDTMTNTSDEDIIDNLLLKDLMTRLDAKERKLIFLRFFRDKTQMEIAKILGVSQVQVSRLITKTISKLQEAVK